MKTARKSPLQKLREKKGWTRAQLAHMLNVSETHVWRLENTGTQRIPTAMRIVKTLRPHLTLEQVVDPFGIARKAA